MAAPLDDLLRQMTDLGPSPGDLLTPTTIGLRRQFSRELRLEEPFLARWFGVFRRREPAPAGPERESVVVRDRLAGFLARLEKGGVLGTAARLLELCRVAVEARPLLLDSVSGRDRNMHLRELRRAVDRLRRVLTRPYPYDRHIARLWVETEQAVRAGFVRQAGF